MSSALILMFLQIYSVKNLQSSFACVNLATLNWQSSTDSTYIGFVLVSQISKHIWHQCYRCSVTLMARDWLGVNIGIFAIHCNYVEVTNAIQLIWIQSSIMYVIGK